MKSWKDKNLSKFGHLDLPKQLSPSVTRIFLDIGGSLVKVAYYERTPRIRLSSLTTLTPTSPKQEQEFRQGGRLQFEKFETKKMSDCVAFLKDNLLTRADIKSLTLTGGGAQKYMSYLEKELNIPVNTEDEIDCVVSGCNFLLRQIPDEAFTYHSEDMARYQFQRCGDRRFPYLLVIIGSGVSIIKVEGEHTFTRIGGSSLGGGTFWGIASLLTKLKKFDEILELSKEGNSTKVDMTVGDIYEGGYEKIGLNADTTASSFGKTVGMSPEDGQNFNDNDVAQGLLEMISNNIGQLAYLYAQLHNLKKIYFGGYFIRNHEATMNAMTNAIKFWSGGTTEALFLRHEGYLGAVGCFVKKSTEANSSWGENFVCSQYSWLNPVGLDMCATLYKRFPLLSKKNLYMPDSFNLTENEDLRDYWLNFFQKLSSKIVRQCVEFEGNTEDSERRALVFDGHMKQLISTLRENPNAYGKLSVRGLFDLQSQCLGECQFSVDSYIDIKLGENHAALNQLHAVLESYRKMGHQERQLALIEGILAGNVFDWGAPEVEKLMVNGQLDFQGARAKLRSPWLNNTIDLWLDKVKEGIPYKKVVIFVDNSGADTILGILPFALELYNFGAKVILACNTWPALNDATYQEMIDLRTKLMDTDDQLRSALESNSILFMPTGSDNVGLDLQRIQSDLAIACENCDLVVLEGMGRAIHTNLYAKFSCDSLKLATIKSERVANLLGGVLYDIVGTFELGD